MKRFVAVIVIFALLLCGCSPKAVDERTMPKCFNASAEIEFDGMTYEAVLSRLADGWWTVEMCSPEAVKGLVFTISGEDTEISFKGLHFTFDTSKFPVGSVVSLAVKSFDRLAPLTLDVVKGESADFASGETDGMAYALTLAKNGSPQTLELGDCGMKITFTSFEVITDSQDGTPEIVVLPENAQAKNSGGVISE